jgi:hypothetical protein
VANLLASAMFGKKGCYGIDRSNLAFETAKIDDEGEA